MVDPFAVMHLRWSERAARHPLATTLAVAAAGGAWAGGCVPSGSAGPQDSGSNPVTELKAPIPPRGPQGTPAAEVMRVPFEDSFDRPAPAPSGGAAAPSSASPAGADPGPEWTATIANVWRIEGGRLCGERAHNHGLWLKRALPVNARIEFDAVSDSPDGDLKAEYWGDGRSFATALSYTNATSYLTIFGGWHNKFHVLARLDEHGNDRKQITVDPNSDDPREKPVVAGQLYHFKVERTDGRSVKWWVDGNEMLTYQDPAPLSGAGHDHFGFNDWEVKVCFDNVRIVPLN